MQLLNAQRRAAAQSRCQSKRAAAAPRRAVRAASGNGAATRLADVDEYHEAWISAVNPTEEIVVTEASRPVPAPTGDRELFATNSRDAYFTRRHELVLKHFPNALGVDDFISRVEIALSAHGFRGDNSIAMTNLCRDEVTTVLKDKIESVFGGSFNTNGLGAVLTCGVTGIGAGLSHSPICKEEGRERYVFFSFPHTAINEGGELGAISRPNRPGQSCACGALAKALAELKAEGLAPNCRVPGVHDPLDPEYSILKQRLARRIRYERIEPILMDLADMTAVAERVITDDLEYLIEKCVDIEKADYAVVTGIQIHNWSTDLKNDNFEFVAPTKVYVVNKGQITVLDLMQLPSLTPRQIQLLAKSEGIEGAPSGISSASVQTALQSLPAEYLAQRICSAPLMDSEDAQFILEHKPIAALPAGTTQNLLPGSGETSGWEPVDVSPRQGVRLLGMPTMDGEEEEGGHTSFRVPKGVTVPSN